MNRHNSLFYAIDSEREYQEYKWGNTGSSGTPGNGERTIDEFALGTGSSALPLSSSTDTFEVDQPVRVCLQPLHRRRRANSSGPIIVRA